MASATATRIEPNQHTIWCNDPDEIESIMESYNAECDDEDEQIDYERAAELCDEYRQDEIINLGSANGGEILAIAVLGLWNGRRSGYKTIDKLTDVLEDLPNYDAYIRFYVDENGELRGRFSHHDGTNYVTYRERRPDCSDENWYLLTSAIYNSEEYSNLLELCTTKLGPKIQKVYGWAN